ncbi:MAG TPA: hypothetical protein PKW75_11495, partial [candidate division Zixibacteria bacterium]|nr:hypothetical protein [candidate division Zixibacteria bacterium]
MRKSRLIYSNGIVGLGRDPGRPPDPPADTPGPALPEPPEDSAATRAVTAALAALSDEEREFVRCFYYMGCTVAQIAGRTGRAEHRLEALRRRVERRLRARLGPFVRARYGIGADPGRACPICGAARREAIEQAIAAKRPEETWGPVLRQLRERFGLPLRSPQTILSHVKFHPKPPDRPA